MSSSAARPPLTQEQLERIAQNKAIALARKRKLEGSVEALCEHKQKRENIAPTHQPQSAAVARALQALDQRQQQGAASASLPIEIQGHSLNRCSDAPARGSMSHPSTNGLQGYGGCAVQSPSSFPTEPRASGSFLAARPSAESWVMHGTMQGQEGSRVTDQAEQYPRAVKRDSFLSYAGKGGQTLLNFGQKQPSAMSAAPRRSENIEKLINSQGCASKKWELDEEEDRNLTQEQLGVKARVMAGDNVFLTGGAGTGKSFLVHNLIKALKKKVGSRGVAITATTGIAASPLGGTSLHAFAGIGIGQGTAKELSDKIKKNRPSKQRWMETKVLIVDEVSMLSGELLEKLNEIAQTVKNNSRRFGGIQLLLVGDFLQLPPVPDKGKATMFCFESAAWEKLVDHHCELQIVHRQANESFVQVLNQVRLGRCDNQATALLRATSRNQLDADGILATKLYTRNSEVDAINERCLRQLSKQSIYYPATDTGQQPFLDQLAKNCLAPAKLELKEGAQVMLLKNLDQENGLVNGTRGVVFKFEDNQNADTGPLGHWPWVRFVGFKGQVDRLITPDKFSVESQGQTLASREQVPLRLAYAITIHKCQGMTLTHAELNLGSAFEFGQAYVALSRVQSLEGLRLVDFDPCAVKAHPRVLDFYQTMKRKNLETDRMNGSRKNPLFVDD